MVLVRRASWFLAAVLVLAAVVGARAPQDPPAFHPDRLEVKLAEGSGAELVEGRLVSRAGVDLAPVARLFATAVEAAPMVTAVPRAMLDAWHERACAVREGASRPGHLGLWFRLRARDAADAERLCAALLQQPFVEHAYHEPIYHLAGSAAPPPDDLPPTTPLFTSMQQAHEPAPTGHGVRAVAGVLGARGQGVRHFMIETSWILDHEDMSQLVAANFLGPVPAFDPAYSHHGVSGSSIVMADRNGYGITGIADEVDAAFVSLELNGGFGNAMALAMAQGQSGDVILVVLMVLVPALGPGTWLPIEFLQFAFDATATATANGFHVVVPAGNGNRSLDDPALLGRFDRSFRDSGAVIVGASQGALLQRAPFSNWGTRIDAHSWGDGVVACGYGTLFYPNGDLRQTYTAAATGTSSSSPHLAGLVASLQGAARRQLGQPLTNAELLDLLHTVGPTTPDVIGRRPDLVAILRQLGVLDGLVVTTPDVPLGGVLGADVEGPPGAIAALFGSFGTADLPLGFNRNVHLDPTATNPLEAFVLTGGAASYALPVPNNASLQGIDVYLQAVRIDPGQPDLFVTNSGQVTIL